MSAERHKMKVYIPYYSNGYHIMEADESARRVGGYWLFRGTIYGPTAYTTEAGAAQYINKQYNDSRKTEYKPML